MSSSALGRAVALVNRAPARLRPHLLTALVRRTVPFVGTAGLVIETLTSKQAVARLANRRRAQNHIHGVHAAAMALLAETVTGFVVAVNLPRGRVPLIKTLHVDYVRRTRGGLRAVATLTDPQREAMAAEPRGEVEVAVEVTDESGEAPIRCRMIWAWRTPER